MFRNLSKIVSQVKPQICIVGSGPAGFYAAQYIANRLKDAQIDILERLPVPFGLVRYCMSVIFSIKFYHIILKLGNIWSFMFISNKF